MIEALEAVRLIALIAQPPSILLYILVLITLARSRQNFNDAFFKITISLGKQYRGLLLTSSQVFLHLLLANHCNNVVARIYSIGRWEKI